MVMLMSVKLSKFYSLLCILICASLVFSSCGSSKKGEKTLRIATRSLSGNFNPFYATQDGDKAVNGQVFRTIQRVGKNNKLINSVGSISYEFEGEKKVKYTVTIKNGLRFSDGTPVTIDDVIFFYYFCADASYDGVYSDFYLNDIEGIKAYYYDDKDWSSALSAFGEKADREKQIKNYIKKNYEDGADVTEIKGIRRIDDCTCTVTYNSRNINAVSQLNAVIVSKAFYTVNYVKGSASAVKNFTTLSMGCGPYYVSNYNPDTKKAELKFNSGSGYSAPSFSKLEFLDIITPERDGAQCVLKGMADVSEALASTASVNKLNGSDCKYFLTDDKSYVSLFINTRSIKNDSIRKQIMKVCAGYDYLDKTYGSHYTKVYMPLSVRFEEYPNVNSPYYSGDTITALLTKEVEKINFYCTGAEGSDERALAEEMAARLNNIGIKTSVVSADESGLAKAAASGKADLWIARIPDGGTCDKYDYWHSGADKNLTGLSDGSIDILTEKIRGAVGNSDKKGLMIGLLNAVMEKAVEMPVYQNQIITVYDSSVISPESIESLSEYDGFTYAIPLLYG